MEQEANDMKKCPYCAEPIRRAAIKCRYCGSILTESRGGGGISSAPGYWRRVNEGKRIAGVCTGIARQLDMPVLVLPLRLFFVLTTVFYFFGVLTYIILWLLMPPPVDAPRPKAFDDARPNATSRSGPDPAAADRAAGTFTKEQSPGSEPTGPDEQERPGDDDVPPTADGGTSYDDWDTEIAATAPEPPSLDETVPVDDEPPGTSEGQENENDGDELARFMLTLPGMVTVGCTLAALFFGWMFAINIFGIHEPGEYLMVLTGGFIVAVIADRYVRRPERAVANQHAG